MIGRLVERRFPPSKSFVASKPEIVGHIAELQPSAEGEWYSCSGDEGEAVRREKRIKSPFPWTDLRQHHPGGLDIVSRNPVGTLWIGLPNQWISFRFGKSCPKKSGGASVANQTAVSLLPRPISTASGRPYPFGPARTHRIDADTLAPSFCSSIIVTPFSANLRQ